MDLIGSKKELSAWQDSILDNVQKFATATEINFRRLYADSEATENENALSPRKGREGFTLNAFCDGLMGITAHLVCTFVGTSPGVEEIAVKALRKKMADFRAHALRTKLTAPTSMREQ